MIDLGAIFSTSSLRSGTSTAVLVPERRDEVLKIAPRSIISGTLVTLITAALVGLVS